MTIKIAKIQMSDGTIRRARIEVPDSTTNTQIGQTADANPISVAGKSVQNLLMSDSPTEALKDYSPFPTQAKANVGLAAVSSLDPIMQMFGIGGVKKGLQAISPTLPEPTPQQNILGESVAGAFPIEKGIQAGFEGVKYGSNMAKAITKESPFIRQISEMVRKPFTEAGEKLGKAIDEIDKLHNAPSSAEYAGIESTAIKKLPLGDDVTKNLSLEDTVAKINEAAVDNPAVTQAIRRSPTLNNIMKNPELAKDVSARMSQDIINELKGTASMQSKLAGATKAMPLDRDVMDIIGLIRKDQLTAYPTLAKEFKDYGKVATNYWNLKNLARPEKATGFMMGETSGYGNAVIRDAIKELSPQALEKIRAYRLAKNIPKYAVPAAIGGGAGILVNEMIKK